MSLFAGPAAGLPAFLLVLVSLSRSGAAQEELPREYQPEVAPASAEGEQALAGFFVAPGFRVELFAAEPFLANPVCFCVDEQGRFYVAETFRHHAGVTDTRDHRDWLDQDLACRTVADREELLRTRDADNVALYTQEQERVRRIVDRDGDGVADEAVTFADGFDDLAGGIGAGLLARRGVVYFANIPDLWLLADENGDGRADRREILHTGYGVHISLLGHDLHGLRMGPDGLLYFSIGDRGFHVEFEGQEFAWPDTGAVLRCAPDGSNLEVFATGLRNPQELAFDEYGNLFTGDNNSDGGDQARFVYVVEGGDSGWHIGYQWIEGSPSRGPWNQEQMWQPYHEGQPAYLVPPLANVASGPSGLTYHPGTGLGGHYQRHFFLCDFRGDPTLSGVHALRLTPHGASFQVAHVERFLWNSLVTDVDFGPDGHLYVSDWVQGWNRTGKGRLFRIRPSGDQADPAAAETRRLLAEGMSHRDTEELLALLAHADQRVRLEAQYTLAEQGLAVLPELVARAQGPGLLLGRIHALWAVGQLQRATGQGLAQVLALAADPNAEIRAQVLKLVGDRALEAGQEVVRAALGDESPRVRFFAALAAGKLGDVTLLPHVVALLAENANQDPFLRHAGVMGLTGMGDRDQVRSLAKHDSAAVRLGVLLAQRRWQDPAIRVFLQDADASLVVEAARAIHDVPIEAAMESLARRLSATTSPDPALVSRAIDAAYRVGGDHNAERIAAYAGRREAPVPLRVNALEALGDWAEPFERDRVTNRYRPLSARSPAVASHALEATLPALLDEAPEDVRRAAARAAGLLEITSAAERLAELALLEGGSLTVRLAALESLSRVQGERLAEALTVALLDDAPRLRTLARELLVKLSPEEALVALQQGLDQGTPIEQQGALEALRDLDDPGAARLLATWLDRLVLGQVPRAIELELVEAAEAHASPTLTRQLAQWRKHLEGQPFGDFRVALYGGDAARGRSIFFEQTAAQCLRCHRVGDEGAGEAGPDLADVGSRLERPRLLESMLDPNRNIAAGYRSETFFLKSREVVQGRVLDEGVDEVVLSVLDEGEVRLSLAQIDERRPGLSSMPTNLSELLTRREIRDLVEYLSTLCAAPPSEVPPAGAGPQE